MIKKILLSFVALALVLSISGFTFFQYNKSPQVFEPSISGLYHDGVRQQEPQSERQTRSGKVVGLRDNYNTYAWLGIPYAKSPVGDLRWRAPRPHEGWSGVHDATKYGAECVQFWGLMAGSEGEVDHIVGNEDCLTLNIWAPQSAAKKKLPTMVWIHGGGNDSGTGKTYQGHNLAGSQEVIVVTINYRVGLLGWFSHDALRKTSTNLEDASGNYGTLDIIQALNWVKNNIAEFGGDPNNVTIFGESAGARNVYSMIASPLAKGLFDKAIAQSGTVDTTLQTLAEDFPDQPNEKAISGLRNSSNALITLVLKQQNPDLSDEQLRAQIQAMPSDEILSLMRGVDAAQLMQLASKNSLSRGGRISVARIIRDGHVIPKESLLTLFKDPDKYNSVPLITGSNRDEQKVFMARNPTYVDLRFGAIPAIKDPERYQTISDYVSRNWKAGAVDEPAKVLNANGADAVYAYRFDWDDMMSNFLVDLPAVLGSAHGMEINYVFGDFFGGPPFHVTYNRSNAEGRKKLSEAMMSYWAEFAYTGSPGRGRNGGFPEWGAWQAQGNNLMLLDAENDGGVRMAEIRTNVADIKKQLAADKFIFSQKDKCQAFASLFLHGYQTSDFWNADEYKTLGCDDYPVGTFRQS